MMGHMHLFTISFLASTVLSYQCLTEVIWTSNSTIGMSVNTTSGIIVGHASPAYPYVSEYLAIPFAEPPIGQLRFMPPKAFHGKDKLVANKPALSCPQPPPSVNYSQPQDFYDYSIAAGSYANHTSEDCLYLNVWTKYPFIGSRLKPVIVWIYGGGFHSGGARDDSQQGAIFADEQDVVMVNFNYRLGLLGFPGAPNTRQNLALLDQRLAIEWVKNNIENFGGDADKITIMGHSAGGASVDYYNFAYEKDPIVHGSIPMSGNVFSFGSHTPQTGALAWNTAATSLGCGNTTTTTADSVLACMRTQSTEALLRATEQTLKTLATILPTTARAYLSVTGAFGPTIDNITVFENYTIRSEQKQFIQAPLLTGVNDAEGCFFAEQGQVPVSVINDLTTVVFTCPTYLTAQARVGARLPVWNYRFFGQLRMSTLASGDALTHIGAYPNTYANACPGRGWHGQEIYVMFGSTAAASGFSATDKELDDGWCVLSWPCHHAA